MRALKYLGGAALAALIAVGLWASRTREAKGQAPRVPLYQVDPFWPKPLPHDLATGKPWVTGEVAGTCVDSQDHVFTVNRGNLVAPETVTAVSSPTVIEFDPAGHGVNAV